MIDGRRALRSVVVMLALWLGACTAGPTPHPGNEDAHAAGDAGAVVNDMARADCEAQDGLWDEDAESCMLSPAAPNGGDVAGGGNDHDASDASDASDAADVGDTDGDADDADDANDTEDSTP